MPSSMTLNDLERVIAIILLFSLNSIVLLANYVTVVEECLQNRPTVSPFQSSTFGHN